MFSKFKKAGFEIIEYYNRKRFLLLLSLLTCILTSIPVMAAEIQTKSYPLAFHVDLRYYLPTSLYIKCDVKEYNMSFPDFSSRESGTRESRFKELLLAMRNNDVEKCLSMSFQKSGMNEKDIQKHNDKIRRLVSECRSLWLGTTVSGKNLEKLKVLNQFYIGNSGLFIYGGKKGAPPESHPFRPMLKFVTTKKDEFVLTRSLDTSDVLLGETMRQMAVSPAKFVALENGKFEYEVPIPDTNDTQHVAYLQFNGQKYDFNIFSDVLGPISSKPTDEVVRLLQKKYLMIAGGSPREALADLYTDESRKKYLEWIKNPESPSYLEWCFKNMATVERKVRFVIDSDPLYIVLYGPGYAPLYNPFVIRDPKDGKLKFANFACSGFLDDLFINRQFRSFLSECIGIR